jgi:hypothetical protein
MYDIVPDLLKAYYVSLGVAFLVGGVIGFGICYSWLRKPDAPGFTSGAGYDAYGYEDEPQPVTDYDARAMRLLADCDFL